MRKRIGWAFLGIFILLLIVANPQGSSPALSPSPTASLVRPSYSAPTQTVQVVYGGISSQLSILNRDLGFPLDELQAMSSEQIQQLIEENVERLQANYYKVVTTTPGVEEILKFQGRNTPTPSGKPTQPSLGLCYPLRQGITFLMDRYNLRLGLLNESPQVAPHRYWLTNDNALAAYTFARLGLPEMSAAITSSIRRYGLESNGLLEVVWGMPISYPPYVARPVKLASDAGDEIWQEFHRDGPRFEDWADYADLGFLGALNAYQQGHVTEARSIYSNTLALFDGTGFRDKAFTGQYETYKLAMALYVGTTLQAAIPNGKLLLQNLQAAQAVYGGFITHYGGPHGFTGDANTETTAWALLAQWVYGCEYSR